MTPEQQADIARLTALRDSGQISAEDFERLTSAIRASDPTPAPQTPDEWPPSAAGGLPFGREKPVRAADPQTTTPWQQPTPESVRDPRAAFEPAPGGGAPDAATPVAPEPATPVAAAAEPGAPAQPAFAIAPPPPTPVLDLTASGAGDPPPPHGAPPPAGPFDRYPMRYGVLYPDHLSRLKTAFRIVFLIPLFVILYLLNFATQALAILGWTAVFWRKKYPKWAFRGITGLLEYQARLSAYFLLQTDKFPSFERDDSLVRLDFLEPEPGTLSRWRVFWWKLFIVIPHFIVLYFLQLAVGVVTLLAWFGILFTGNYPRGMFGFATGFTRWHLRVQSYFLSLHDSVPPYSLSDDAGAGSRGAAIASGIGGLTAVAGIVGIIIAVVIATGRTHNEDVSYAALQAGTTTTTRLTSPGAEDIFVQLQKVTDPGNTLIPLLHPTSGEKVVVFQWRISNGRLSDIALASNSAHLSAISGGDEHGYSPVLTAVNDSAAPVTILGGGTVTVQAVFVVPIDAQPTKLQFHNGFAGRGGITYRFH